MVDPENRDRRWNATFTDYSSHLAPGKLKLVKNIMRLARALTLGLIFIPD